MQFHFSIGELVVIAVIALIALFWLIPVIGKKNFNRPKNGGDSKTKRPDGKAR
ncbi:MAG: hypothetical protein GXY72_06920 [Deltaproteobacteria bacterium]|nr:hypothetical protein [Deltaproteobacteria bacterium]